MRSSFSSTISLLTITLTNLTPPPLLRLRLSRHGILLGPPLPHRPDPLILLTVQNLPLRHLMLPVQILRRHNLHVAPLRLIPVSEFAVAIVAWQQTSDDVEPAELVDFRHGVAGEPFQQYLVVARDGVLIDFDVSSNALADAFVKGGNFAHEAHWGVFGRLFLAFNAFFHVLVFEHAPDLAVALDVDFAVFHVSVLLYGKQPFPEAGSCAEFPGSGRLAVENDEAEPGEDPCRFVRSMEEKAVGE